MIISEKLYKLRNASGLSQEEVAEKLNVSRQSVSKWESAASIPSTDKIVELSKLYGVSLDYLLKDEIEEAPSEIVADTGDKRQIREVGLEEVTEYFARVTVSSKRIALGVMLCIFSPAPLLTLLGFVESKHAGFGENTAAALGTAGLLVLVAIAAAIFIMNAISMSRYEYLAKEEFQLTYGVNGAVEKEEQKYTMEFAKKLAAGVVLCIVSVIPLVLVGILFDRDDLAIDMASLLLVICGIGVYLIVQSSIVKGGYQRVLQKGDYSKARKRRSAKMDAIATVYWCLTTAIYLGISFWYNNWNISWIIWPVAGVLYAAIEAICSIVLPEEDKM